jgi:hypothetical protein
MGQEPAETARETQPRQPRAPGLRLLGVLRARGWRGARGRAAEPVLRVRYRALEALVQAAPYAVPPFDVAALRGHQRVLDGVLRRGTVLPLPYGVVFRGRRPLIRFLEEQYLVLDEGLSLLEGHWELRVHVAAPGIAEPAPELSELATQHYTELRRHARAAVPFPRTPGRLLSAAFLVDRRVWVEFVERSEQLGALHPELTLDVTGPWPPYDFVRLLP